MHAQGRDGWAWNAQHPAAPAPAPTWNSQRPAAGQGERTGGRSAAAPVATSTPGTIPLDPSKRAPMQVLPTRPRSQLTVDVAGHAVCGVVGLEQGQHAPHALLHPGGVGLDLQGGRHGAGWGGVVGPKRRGRMSAAVVQRGGKAGQGGMLDGAADEGGASAQPLHAWNYCQSAAMPHRACTPCMRACMPSHTGVAQAGLRPPPASHRHRRQVPGVVGKRGWVHSVGIWVGWGAGQGQVVVSRG